MDNYAKRTMEILWTFGLSDVQNGSTIYVQFLWKSRINNIARRPKRDSDLPFAACVIDVGAWFFMDTSIFLTKAECGTKW